MNTKKIIGPGYKVFKFLTQINNQIGRVSKEASFENNFK